jgi:hypothetical protein
MGTLTNEHSNFSPTKQSIAKMPVIHFQDTHMCTLRDTKDQGIFRILSKRRKIKLNEFPCKDDI